MLNRLHATQHIFTRRTALHRALYHGHLAASAALLQAGASTATPDYKVMPRHAMPRSVMYWSLQ